MEWKAKFTWAWVRESVWVQGHLTITSQSEGRAELIKFGPSTDRGGELELGGLTNADHRHCVMDRYGKRGAGEAGDNSHFNPDFILLSSWYGLDSRPVNSPRQFTKFKEMYELMWKRAECRTRISVESSIPPEGGRTYIRIRLRPAGLRIAVDIESPSMWEITITNAFEVPKTIGICDLCGPLLRMFEL